jgi:small nuclear ribonucleoprotein (snRNP)-like protein
MIVVAVAAIAAITVIGWRLLEKPAEHSMTIEPDPEQPSAIDARIRHRVIVTLRSGESFAGLLFEADERVWILRNAEAIAAGDRGTNLIVDGEIVIPAENVAFAQRP